MSLEKKLKARSESKCELCGAGDDLSVYQIPPVVQNADDKAVLTCSTCKGQIEAPETTDPNHWRCLNDSMWSEVAAVQVVAWRMLSRMKSEGWPQDLLDMMYLDEEALEWAKATGEGEEIEEGIKHIDSNGVQLQHGDNVVVIKDLNVKGSSLVAKRGTAVRGITLVHDNAEQIEGRVGGQQIVLLTKYVKKS